MSKHPAADLVEKGFCQGVLARNDEGVPVYPLYKTATHFCALGAIAKAYENSDDIDRIVKQRNLRHHIEDQGYDCVQNWNDEVDQSVVVQTLKSLEI